MLTQRGVTIWFGIPLSLLLVFPQQNSLSSHSASFPEMLRICTNVAFDLRPPGSFSALTLMSSSRSPKSWCLHLCISALRHPSWMWTGQVTICATQFSVRAYSFAAFPLLLLLPSPNHPCSSGCLRQQTRQPGFSFIFLWTASHFCPLHEIRLSASRPGYFPPSANLSPWHGQLSADCAAATRLPQVTAGILTALP